MNQLPEFKVSLGSTDDEMARKLWLAKRLRESSVPDSELLDNLGLYLTRQTLSRINFIQEMYSRIVNVHGVIIEFGVRWGQNMALFSNLRGMLEPFNFNRQIIGFDTFDGFPSISPQDHSTDVGGDWGVGDYGVTENWVKNLENLLEFHEQNSPIAHKKKYELVVGDASETLPQYLEEHPETIIALAYFDFDLYAPTRDCLKAIKPHLTKGSVLAFDELNCPDFPGETLALREVLGLDSFSIRRLPLSPLTSFLVIE